ncbi:MAG: zinc-binding dehydrogenase [Armatimonadota bacterium]|nr:zinc-binding dehydrogenase [Armatimonadota bacterium]MDW8026273.1 zinc-binding dehydrogenase [Armatimonadota bacterium]
MTHTHTVVCERPNEVIIREEPLPELGHSMFLVRAKLTAISTGTEMTLVTGDFEPDSVWARLARYPLKLGYSHLGEVIAVGDGVDGVQVGDRVVGWKNHSQFVIYRAGEFFVKVPDDILDESAVLFSLAVISLNGVRKAKVQLGECAIVFGLGPIGIWAAQFAYLCGARPVIGVDLLENRRSLAERVKAVDMAFDGADENLTDKVAELTKGRMADVIFEVTGNPRAILDEVKLLRKQGRLIILSSPRGKTEFDFHDWCNWTSISIIGAHNSSHPPHENPDDPWTQRRNVEVFFELIRRSEVATTQLITHRFKWGDAPKAYELLVKERGQTGIVILDWQQSA